LAISKEALSLLSRGKIGPINEKQKEILGMANKNIDRLSLLINDILDVSKIEAKKMSLNREDIHLNKFMEETCKGWELEAKKKKIDFSLSQPENSIALCVDLNRLSQILANLINNALKFTPAGGRIIVSVSDRDSDVEFSIADTGFGMRMEDIPKIFEKFQQLGRTYGPGIKGTGLGLSIVKSLVELHGGTITVESEVDKGSVFRFTIPKEIKENSVKGEA
jgi:signal transduction histidine kinase